MHTLAELTLGINQDTVATALQWLESTGEQAGWPSRTRFKLRLCLDETLTNITMYGHKDAGAATGEPRVKLRVLQEGVHLTLEISDNGVAFDPTAQTPRQLDASLDEARIGGHGLRLMRHYLEDIRYERRNGWNCLRLLANTDETP